MKLFKVALIGQSDPNQPAWVRSQLEQAGITFASRECQTAKEIVGLAADADIVWTMGSNMIYGADGWREIIREALPGLTRCGAIIRSGSGTDNIPVDDATRRNILVVNTPAATAEPVAEFAVALMLSVGRQIVMEAIKTRAGEWTVPSRPTQHALIGRTVGLVGFGQIAQLVARNLTGFNTTIIAFDPLVDPQVMRTHGVEKCDLDDLLARADYISLHCPLTDATRGLIGRAQLAQMKSSAVLINTSRGPIVDETALIESLQKHQIAGAGLDVLEHEPAAVDNPLLKMSRVVVTPHVASFSEQVFQEMWRLSVESAIDLAQGFWPRSYVNTVSPAWALRERTTMPVG